MSVHQAVPSCYTGLSDVGFPLFPFLPRFLSVTSVMISEMDPLKEANSETDQHLLQLFQSCDIDGSGFIGIEEVKEICLRIGASDSDATEIFLKLDRDGDGKVSFEDFRAGFDDYEKGLIVASTPLLSPSQSNNQFSFPQDSVQRNQPASSLTTQRRSPAPVMRAKLQKPPRYAAEFLLIDYQ